MEIGTIIMISLTHPTEKYWGRLEALGSAGATVRGINLASLEDWIRDLVNEQDSGLAPTTVFFPLHRVERISLDESTGMIESLGAGFERRVGHPLGVFLDHDAAHAGASDPGETGPAQNST